MSSGGKDTDARTWWCLCTRDFMIVSGSMSSWIPIEQKNNINFTRKLIGRWLGFVWTVCFSSLFKLIYFALISCDRIRQTLLAWLLLNSRLSELTSDETHHPASVKKNIKHIATIVNWAILTECMCYTMSKPKCIIYI